VARSTGGEVAQRIDTVYNLLLRGVGRYGIRTYAEKHGWAVSLRQLDTYTARAVLAAQIELLGLAAAQRHELSGPGGASLLSQEETAAQFRAQLEAKVKRLDQDSQEQ
jgi:hypothetical protein